MNNLTHALILAAGLGTRLRPITLEIPKPMIKVSNISMLQRVCEHLVNAGLKNIIINTHYLWQQIDDFLPILKDLYKGVNFYVSYEEKLLDVGGAIKKVALDFSLQELIVFNSDILIYNCPTPLNKILNTWDDKMDCLFYLKHKSAVTNASLGDFNLINGNILKRDIINEYIYTGISIYKTDPIKNILLDSFNIMTSYIFPNIENKKFYGCLAEFEFLDIGSHNNLEYAHTIFK